MGETPSKFGFYNTSCVYITTKYNSVVDVSKTLKFSTTPVILNIFDYINNKLYFSSEQRTFICNIPHNGRPYDVTCSIDLFDCRVFAA